MLGRGADARDVMRALTVVEAGLSDTSSSSEDDDDETFSARLPTSSPRTRKPQAPARTLSSSSASNNSIDDDTSIGEDGPSPRGLKLNSTSPSPTKEKQVQQGTPSNSQTHSHTENSFQELHSLAQANAPKEWREVLEKLSSDQKSIHAHAGANAPTTYTEHSFHELNSIAHANAPKEWREVFEKLSSEDTNVSSGRRKVAAADRRSQADENKMLHKIEEAERRRTEHSPHGLSPERREIDSYVQIAYALRGTDVAHALERAGSRAGMVNHLLTPSRTPPSASRFLKGRTPGSLKRSSASLSSPNQMGTGVSPLTRAGLIGDRTNSRLRRGARGEVDHTRAHTQTARKGALEAWMDAAGMSPVAERSHVSRHGGGELHSRDATRGNLDESLESGDSADEDLRAILKFNPSLLSPFTAGSQPKLISSGTRTHSQRPSARTPPKAPSSVQKALTELYSRNTTADAPQATSSPPRSQPPYVVQEALKELFSHSRVEHDEESDTFSHNRVEFDESPERQSAKLLYKPTGRHNLPSHLRKKHTKVDPHECFDNYSFWKDKVIPPDEPDEILSFLHTPTLLPKGPQPPLAADSINEPERLMLCRVLRAHQTAGLSTSVTEMSVSTPRYDAYSPYDPNVYGLMKAYLEPSPSQERSSQSMLRFKESRKKSKRDGDISAASAHDTCRPCDTRYLEVVAPYVSVAHYFSEESAKERDAYAASSIRHRND